MAPYHVVADVCDLSVYAEPCGGFGNSTLSFEETTCQWVEQLQPENRTDGWPGGIGWLNMHTIEAMEIATADKLQGLDLVIYGDSISENWRGTSMGLPYTRQENGTTVTDTTDFVAPDMRATFFKTLGSQYKTAVMAIAGDHIGHLWWRLLNGQMPKKAPKVAIVLIGTNDLFAALQFQQLLEVMRQGMPGTHIVVQGLYPRGADMQANKYVWPDNFTYARNLINADYQAQHCSIPFALRGTTSDCCTTAGSMGLTFLFAGSNWLQEYLPDGLHPNAKGLKIIAECLMPLLEKIFAMNETQQATEDLQKILKVPETGKAVTGAHHTNLTLPTYKKPVPVHPVDQPAKLVP
ncbi:hypothetical protein COCOBI_15-3490 [Coccomyxa sp. Obi]|nr:hypothetical protein COCOBI_15-3490 [Coccomyxa sp. Obi]